MPSVTVVPMASSTQEVLDHHLKSFSEGNLEDILSDYDPVAVLFTPRGPLNGHEAIKQLFEAFFSEFEKPGATFAMTHLTVQGEYAYILWNAETADNTYDAATDTFVVRNGKIVAQTFAAKITPKA